MKAGALGRGAAWRGREPTPYTKDPPPCLAGVKKLGSVTFSKVCPHVML